MPANIFIDSPLLFPDSAFLQIPNGLKIMVELFCDIVINGGSMSAPAAALAAAREFPEAEIILLEPTDWLGGQATSQGVAAIDNAWHDPGARLMRDNPALYYPADYLDFIDRIKKAPASLPGQGYGGDGCSWVSREAFDPRTAAAILDEMVAEHPRIRTIAMTVLKSVVTEPVTDDFGAGARITGLTAVRREPIGNYQPGDRFLSEEIDDWYDTADSQFFRKEVLKIRPRGERFVVIDASELGDAVVLSGAKHTVGRELQSEEMTDSGDFPPMDEDGTQSFVYIFCQTTAPAPVNEDALKEDFVNFDSYLAQQSNAYFSFKQFTWERIWTYRRLQNTGAPWQFDDVNSGDVCMQNWFPGNDYPYGALHRDVQSAQAEAAQNWMGGVDRAQLAEAEKHAVAWHFYFKQRDDAPTETRYLRGDDPLNMMGTAHGLSKFPYIRGTRRIAGLHNFRLTGRTFTDTNSPAYDDGASFRFFDSVGIGNYAADVHPTNISEGLFPEVERPAPFYIPYRALGSSNVRNLLAAGKLIATTYVTNSAYRLHPIEWAIGSAAGTAAAQMADGGLSNYDLLETERLRAMQASVNENSPISWQVYDDQPIPSPNGDLIINDRKPIAADTPFSVEIFHHRGERAIVYLDGERLGLTDRRVNGRLILDVESAPAGAEAFAVRIYSASGVLLDVLGEGPLPAEEREGWIVE